MSPVTSASAKSGQGNKRTRKREPSSTKNAKKREKEDPDRMINKGNAMPESDLGLNQIAFHQTMVHPPFCSCTGVPRQCYKWGSGGWQSSCCTTMMSMYPLPVVPNKKRARVGGRKIRVAGLFPSSSTVLQQRAMTSQVLLTSRITGLSTAPTRISQ
ncbi:hypothetical protein SAY87_022243 [Trapa incisa]|uniref:GAGA-binding transcriptional activator n=1 Tax=Trapa incisa TaxID=236973 RepID=A0AAN7JVF5_9MYRT|nr:hypothetical protein SAY87_022243 [Trapa incisa]